MYENCIDNSDGFDNFWNEQKIKLEVSNLTEINLNKSTKITTATLNDLQAIQIGASYTKRKKIMNVQAICNVSSQIDLPNN